MTTPLVWNRVHHMIFGGPEHRPDKQQLIRKADVLKEYYAVFSGIGLCFVLFPPIIKFT